MVRVQNVHESEHEIPSQPLVRALLIFAFVSVLAACGTEIDAEDNSPSRSSAPGTSTPPTAPTGLSATAASDARIDLSWNASTDDVGVTGYELQRCQGAACTNFAQIATPSASPYSDTFSLLPSTTYRYRVRAIDGAGNLSQFSQIASATTQAAPGGPLPDTTPPSAPTNLTATAAGDARIDLSWNASTDDVGVTGYELQRCQGAACTNFAQIATPSASPYSDTSSLQASTTYRYRARATDGAGNLSQFSQIAEATTQAATGGQLPVGALAHDGPATPEQIALVLPVTGTLPQTATATVRYKQTSSAQWITGHPLYRVRPGFSVTPQAGGAIQDVFAWPITDVLPGTSYDIEVTVNSGSTTNVKTLTHSTRALPAAAGAPNKTANSAAAIVSHFSGTSGLNPGDVLEIAAGTYNVNGLTLSRSGTVNSPIYVRGASRTGTVLLDTTGSILSVAASHVIIENLTLQGAGTDGGVSSGHTGVSLDTAGHTRITLRHLRILGVDRGVDFTNETTQTLVYDNTLVGNNLWISSFLNTNITWDDEGIKLPGSGNAAFNNTISRFGDTFAYASHNSGAETDNIAIHYYRNEIRNSGDDVIEVDHGRRNLTWYDNRIHNAITCDSLDPLYGGPWLSARNICINPYRVNTHKWNTFGSGQFLYNNTIIGTVSNGADADVANWYQPQSGGAQRAYGYRNNLHVYRGNGQSIWLESTVHDPIDWTHNSWFPDRAVQWGAFFNNLAAAQSGLANTTPVFSGTSRRMSNDNITTTNPWTTTITLPAHSGLEFTGTFMPILAPGTPKNSGVVIPNITDGFSGGAPDRGAIIEGRTPPVYGDRTP